MIRHLCSIIVLTACRLFFRSVRLLGIPSPQSPGPILYVGFHKNGLLDKWVASCVLPGVRFLRDSGPLDGLEEIDPALPTSFTYEDQSLLLEEAIDILENGASLFLLLDDEAEGTNSLAPNMAETALIASLASRKRADLTIVPAAFFYDDPGRWGGRAEVVLGDPFPALPSADEPDQLQASIVRGIRVVEDDFNGTRLSGRTAEQIAFLASFDDSLSYALSLRIMRELPAQSAIVEGWQVYREFSADCFSVNGVALFPTGTFAASAAKCCASALFLTVNALFNCIPLLASFIFSLIAQDGRFSPKPRLLSGSVALLLWIPIFWAACCWLGLIWAIPVHLFLSATTGYWIGTLKISAAETANSLRNPRMRDVQERLREELLSLIL